MATKKKTKKKVTRKPAGKKALKKKAAPRKAAKKAPARKKTGVAKKKKSIRKSSRSVAASTPSFPTMMDDERSDDFYSSPTGDTYGGMPDIGREDEGGGSSRGVALLAIFLIVAVVIGVVVYKKELFKSGKTDPVHKTGKMTKKGPAKKAVVVKKTAKTGKKTVPTDGIRRHKLKKKEWLSHLARRYKVSVRSIMKLNKYKSAREPKPGDTVLIPRK